MILHATNDGSGIDPKIGKMPELEKPPLSSFNSYKLLDRPKLSLAKGKSTTVKLVTGRDLCNTPTQLARLRASLVPVGQLRRLVCATVPPHLTS
mgnify:CR=1 FL=1